MNIHSWVWCSTYEAYLYHCKGIESGPITICMHCKCSRRVENHSNGQINVYDLNVVMIDEYDLNLLNDTIKPFEMEVRDRLMNS